MGSKNLGQVAGVHIGSVPPDNTLMIWYDSTPSQMCHKIYDTAAAQWVILDQKVVSVITYSELVGIAQSVGLSLGKFYKITDRSNALAVAITTTKVQYTDTVGNILIDDLGTNIQYHVTSSNLQIDDLPGTFDPVDKKLVFKFDEYVPVFTDDFLLAKVRRNDIWRLAKFKISSFLSTVTGNSITWNGGFFFNFAKSISDIKDKQGGVVSYDNYVNDKSTMQQSINNVSTQNQQIIQNAVNAINEATTAEQIYSKKDPYDITSEGSAIDLAKGDTIHTMFVKIQRWINQFKIATGIKIAQNFSLPTTYTPVNNNDTVNSAIAKIAKWLNDTGEGSIPELKKSIIYDYVIDSDAKLAGLIDNDDAVNVLIKRGTWKYDWGESVQHVIRLKPNVKIIDAEPGSLLEITGSIKKQVDNSTRSVFVRDNTNGPITRINGVRLSVISRDTPETGSPIYSSRFYCFQNLENLTDCAVVKYDVYRNLSSFFKSCNFLSRCFFEPVIGSNTVMDGAFRDCNNLNGCTYNQVISSELATLNLIEVFSYCSYVSNCKVTGFTSTVFNIVGFQESSFVDNCYFAITSSGNSLQATGFSHCSYVNNCRSRYITSMSNASIFYGFIFCNKISLCLAEVSVTDNSSAELPNVRGYWHVQGLTLCRASKFSITDNLSYVDSYTNSSGTPLLTPADTADGGWNTINV